MACSRVDMEVACSRVDMAVECSRVDMAVVVVASLVAPRVDLVVPKEDMADPRGDMADPREDMVDPNRVAMEGKAAMVVATRCLSSLQLLFCCAIPSKCCF